MSANVEIEGEDIVIRIPIGALPIAVPIACDAVWGSANQGYRVTDAQEFAKELRLELLRESETGQTAVTRMLDRAVATTIENGAEGVAEDEGAC